MLICNDKILFLGDNRSQFINRYVKYDGAVTLNRVNFLFEVKYFRKYKTYDNKFGIIL